MRAGGRVSPIRSVTRAMCRRRIPDNQNPENPMSLNVSAASLDAIFDPLDSASAPGGSVAIEVGGRIVYARGFGLASVSSGLANTVRTRGRIGSTSKQFTCFAVMLLAEDGQVDIDAPLRRWIPELHADLPPVTVRQAMNHSAGLRCWLDVLMTGNGVLTQFPESEVLPLTARQRAVQFEPGSRMLYSNSGTRLLSLLVERVSGKPFDVFLRERVLAPLGMWDTELPASEAELLPALAEPHLPNGRGGYQRGRMPSTVFGEGGLISTVHDLMRWTAFLRAPGIGSAATWREMLKTVTYANGAAEPYALGLMDERHRGLRVVHHAGAVIGANSQLLIAPERELGIAILANRADISSVELVWKVIDALLGAELAPAPAYLSGKRAAALRGYYVHPPSGRTVSLDIGGGRLCFDQQSSLTPLAIDGDALSLNQSGSMIRLKAATDTARPDLLLEQWGLTQRLERREPVAGTMYLPRLQGRYFSDEA
ncbi:MAG: serine hydrolase domain-containing protein, partial [Myxococcota bacterium]